MAPPTTTPGGNPVTAVPGLTPTFPLTVVAPVLVTVDPPRTPKLCAVPREICAKAGMAVNNSSATVMDARPNLDLLFMKSSFRSGWTVKVSELDFLARRANVASFAQPAVRGELERTVVLVAEER